MRLRDSMKVRRTLRHIAPTVLTMASSITLLLYSQTAKHSTTSNESAPIASITIIDSQTNRPTTEVVVSEGDSVKPTLIILDTNGVQRTDFVLNYVSLDTDVATMGPSGTIFGVRAGFSTLTISSGGVVTTGTITVVRVDSGFGGFDINGIAQDRGERVYLANTNDQTLLISQGLKQTPVVYAGVPGLPGLKNDLRLASLFNNPGYLAFNQASGDLYVSDSTNHVIRRVLAGPDGKVGTVAGSGSAGSLDGSATSASFNLPQGVALDNRGYLWVADSNNHTVRRINLATTTVETIAGKAGSAGSDDGKGEAARFNLPVGIALETESLAQQLERESRGEPPPPVRVIVADTSNGLIRRVNEDGTVETIRSPNQGLPTASQWEPETTRLPLTFSSPTGIAVDPFGVIYVSEPSSDRVRAILRNGEVVTLAQAETFTLPRGIVITQGGRVVVADRKSSASAIVYGEPQIRSITPERVSSKGGAKITISGRNFAQDTSIVAAGVIITDTKIVDTQTVTFTSPVLPSGRTTLTVQNRGGLAQTSLRVDAVPLNELPNGYITTVGGGTTFAGDGGPAPSATIVSPIGMVVDTAGNLLIADVDDHRIRKVDARTGVITTEAGIGQRGFSGDNSKAFAAQLNSPTGLAIDTAGSVFIADSSNHRIRKLDARNGIVSTVAGTGESGYSGDGGPATAARLNSPYAIALDLAGNLFIADTRNHRTRKVDARTGIITTVAGNGEAGFDGDGGPATAARVSVPRGIVLDAAGNLLICQQNYHRVRKVNAGTGIITTVAGTGANGFSGDNGPATSAWLSYPQGIAIDSAGNLFIADSSNHRIRKVSPTSGIITTVSGNGQAGFSGDGGSPTAAQLRYPEGIATDASGNVFISDRDNRRIRRINALSNMISTIAGNGKPPSLGDNDPATLASLSFPVRIAQNAAGDLFVADRNNNRIRKVDARTGIITTLAGTGEVGFSGDEGPATAAKLSSPVGIAVDVAGNLFVADVDNHRIRKVDAATGIITTVAGTFSGGAFSGDGGPAIDARLNYPAAVAVDTAGNLFIGDGLNFRVRKVDVGTGIITTVAGNGLYGFSGDNVMATSTSLGYPAEVAVDSASNLFIADGLNYRVRKVEAGTGMITTVAGDGKPGFSGDGGQATSARFGYPRAVAVDGEGNLFIADEDNHRIRKVAAGTGVITTVAGGGNPLDRLGDNRPATDAKLYYPWGIAIDKTGNLLIADTSNNRIRAVRGSSGADLSPRLDITLSKSAYAVGDAITAAEFRVRNPNASPVRVRLRVWFKVPTIGEVAIIDIGSDGSFSLPSSVDSNLGPLSFFTVTSSFPPRGSWQLNSRLTNPSNGALQSEDINSFVIQ